VEKSNNNTTSGLIERWNRSICSGSIPGLEPERIIKENKFGLFIERERCPGLGKEVFQRIVLESKIHRPNNEPKSEATA
jgi:hypothetical protein